MLISQGRLHPGLTPCCMSFLVFWCSLKHSVDPVHMPFLSEGGIILTLWNPFPYAQQGLNTRAIQSCKTLVALITFQQIAASALESFQLSKWKSACLTRVQCIKREENGWRSSIRWFHVVSRNTRRLLLFTAKMLKYLKRLGSRRRHGHISSSCSYSGKLVEQIPTSIFGKSSEANICLTKRRCNHCKHMQGCCSTMSSLQGISDVPLVIS